LVTKLIETYPEVEALIKNESKWAKFLAEEYKAIVEEESKQLAVGTERRASYLEFCDVDNDDNDLIKE